MRSIRGWAVAIVAASLLTACGTDRSPVNSGGSGAPPPIEQPSHQLPEVVNQAAAVADAAGVSAPAAVVPVEWKVGAAKAVDLSFSSLEVAAYGIDALVETGKVKPRSPAALDLATKIDAVRTFLNAARHAVNTLDAAKYSLAMDQAEMAWADANRAVALYKGVKP